MYTYKAYVLGWLNFDSEVVETIGIFSERHPTSAINRGVWVEILTSGGNDFHEAAEAAYPKLGRILEGRGP